MEQRRAKEQAFSNISTRSFVTVVILLTVVLLVSGALSYFIPQGAFLRDEQGVLLADSFQMGEVEGIAVWRILTAPIRVFWSEDALTIWMIGLFLLIMSGVFNLLDKTGGIRVFIGRLMRKLHGKNSLVICLCVLIFMLFGSFFGMFEELVTLLPLVIVFMLSLGMDTMTGLGACMLAACFGFSAAITNPFSVGLATQMAVSQGIETSVLSGVGYRILLFVVAYAVLCGFLLLHQRRIAKHPERSLSFAIDEEKRKNLIVTEAEEGPKERKLFLAFALFFLVQIVLLLLIASVRAVSGYAIPILAVSFLIGGIAVGFCVTERKRDTFRYLGQGALAMLPAMLMIALASSVKLVMTESGILDTVMNAVIGLLSGKSKFVAVLLIYALILFLQVFIGSASAKIMLVMPIVLPICSALGIPSSVVILAYCMADGFTDVFLPTNPVLLVGLSMANVSYGTWAKWTWKLQIGIFLLTVLILLLAVSV